MQKFIQSLNNFKNNGLSVIITAYKSQDFIEECLDSIQNQSYFKYNDNYEILVGIDACESTLKKVNEIRKKYRNLKVFYASENGGTYRMRNSLWIRAKYENLLFFDSDDIMPENFISPLMKSINSYDVVYYKGISFNDDYIFKKRKKENLKSLFEYDLEYIKNNLKGIKFYSNFADGSAIYKSKVLRYINGYFDRRVNVDADLNDRIKMSNMFKIMYLTEHYFFYRKSENSLTMKKESNHKSQLRLNIKKENEERKRKGIIKNDIIAVSHIKRVF